MIVGTQAGNQRSSEVIRGHQSSSELIRAHQSSSEVLTFVAGSYTKKGSSTVEVRARASTAPRTSHVRSATIKSLLLPEARRPAS